MRIIFAILVGIVALLLGLSIRTATNPSAKTDLDENLFPIQSSDRVHSSSSHQHSLKNALDISDSTQRWLQTVAILEKAELGDMIGIAQSVGFADDQLSKLVAQRWLELDPQHFLDTTLAEIKSKPHGEWTSFDCFEFIQFIAKEWPKHDFDAALAAFSQPDPHWHLDAAKVAFVDHLRTYDFKKSFEISLRLNTNSPRIDAQALQQNGPRSIAQILFERFNSQDSHFDSTWVPGGSLIETVAKFWGKTDPLQALAFAESHQNDQGRLLEAKVIENWLMNDRHSAAAWLAGQSPELQERHRTSLIKSWASEDPQRALTFSKENLQDPATHEATLKSLLDGAATKSIADAASLIPQLDDPKLKNIAVTEITDRWFRPDENYDIPKGAIDWLRALDDPTSSQLAMEGAMEIWAKTSPDSMQSFLEEERNFDYPTGAYEKLIESLTLRDPLEALSWSSSQGNQSEKLIQKSAEIWVTKRPEAAINWLRNSLGNEPAKEAIRNALSSYMSAPEELNFVIKMVGPKNKAWLQKQFDK